MTEQFDISNILSVYSGRIGCCCGCIGKHTFSKHGQKIENLRREYPIEDEDVSDRSVKIIAKRVLLNPEVEFSDDFGHAYVDDTDANRTRIVYFVDRELAKEKYKKNKFKSISGC